MPSSSGVTRQTEEVLDEVLRIIQQEYESPYPVLCETDRNIFVKEEESFREQLNDRIESHSSSWRSLLCLPSPQAVKCLKNAQELRRRVKQDINTKLRTRLTGKSNPRSPSWHGRNSVINSTGTSTPVNDSPAVANDDDSSPPEMSSESSDRSRNSTSRRHRRSPPPPPTRRIDLSSNSRPLSETSSNSSSDSPGRSSSVRRPAPPPPQSPRQSRTHRSPTNVSFPFPAPLPPDPDMLSSISRLAQHMNTLASSIATEGSPRQAHGRQRQRHSDYVTKANCLDIKGSNVDGVTVNNGGSYNSGAVIHKMTSPSRLP